MVISICDVEIGKERQKYYITCNNCQQRTETDEHIEVIWKEMCNMRAEVKGEI